VNDTKGRGNEIRRHLNYANVTATLALVLAVAGGTAYAVDKVTSGDIANNAVRSIDLRNHKAVRSRDVVGNSITGRQIDESTLSVGPLIGVAGTQTGTECVLTDTPRSCVTATIELRRSSHLLVITTGNEESLSAPAESSCSLAIDGVEEPLGVHPGEVTDNTRVLATNGFARTLMSRFPVDAGKHTVSLRCERLGGRVRIDEPTIAVIAVAAGLNR
jgi:hypothetical protein